VPLSPGVRLGPYEIVSPLGAGGMGEVYRARDTRLDRDVAIKVLPEGAAADPERRRRFEQEARAVSALNHPHICTLHDVGESVPSTPGSRVPDPEPPAPEPVHYLVMECVEGQTLADRLVRGPLPLDEVLRYGAEVADALAAAHGRGIIHRDLKPANVMLTKTGVKLLDFGLAKLKGPAADQALALSAMVTGSAPRTAEGTLLGTLSYMAPEQVEGRETDARTDLFAFGALLYEMAAGRRAFEGASAASVIAAILEHEPPPLGTIQPTSPPLLDRIIRACLAKNPDERVQSARDLALQLTWLRETANSGTQPGALAGSAAGQTVLRRRWLPWVAAASTFLAGAAIAGAWFVRRAPVPPAPRPVVRFTLEIPAGRAMQAMALAPDGQAFAYVGSEGGQTQLYLHGMDQSADAPLPGTSGAAGTAVAFSPDGKWVAFVAGTTVRKVPVTGGEPVTVAQAPAAGQGQRPLTEGVDRNRDITVLVNAPTGSLDWSSDGTMLFSLDSTGIWRLAPSGAAPARVTATDAARGEYAHTSPFLMPDGRHALFSIRTGMRYDAAPLAAVALDTGRQQRLLPDGLRATLVGSEHLLYASGGRLLAVPVDAAQVRLRGDPVPVVEALGYNGPLPLYAVSRSGDLAYVAAAPPRPASLVRVDRRGKEQFVAELPAGVQGALSLAPDGRRMATSRVVSLQMSAWMLDIARGIPEELPLDRNAHSLVWLPDGVRLAFSSDRDGAANIFDRDAGGSAPSERLVTSSQHGDPGSWSRDGRWLAYAETSPLTSWDLWTYDTATRQARVFLRTEALERTPAISPSGRWLAYSSDRSGRFEVYVEAFPAGGQRVQVSGGGGTEPAWSNDGRTLFFVSGGRLMRVGITDGPVPALDKPVALFDVGAYLAAATYGPAGYAVTPDGEAFYFVKPAAIESTPAHVHVVLGWLDEFTRSLKR
jgi:eukaryotic-like serine/threonine-protein kinase